MTGSEARGGLWWKRGLVSLAALVLLFLAARLVWVSVESSALDRAVAGFEEKWGPLSLSSLRPPEARPHENQSRFFRAAADLLVITLDDERTLRGRGGRQSITRRVAADPEGVRALIERNRTSLTLAAEGASLPASDWEIRYEAGIDARLPNLRDLARLGRILAAEAHLRLSAGDDDGAIEALDWGLALSSSLLRESVLIVGLVGNSIEANMFDVLRAALARADLTPAQMARLEGMIRELPGVETFEKGLRGETATLHAVLLDITAGERSEVWASGQHLRGTATWLLRPAYLRAHAWYLDEMSRILDLMDEPHEERDAVERKSAIPWYVRVLSFAPDNDWILGAAHFAAARRGLAETAVALRRHRVERGEWPASLDDLSPAYLEEVPVDPFTGKPFDYTKKGSGVLLRSAGEEYAVKTSWLSPSLMIWELAS